MDNQMKANPDKCHFSCNTNDTVHFDNQVIDK